MILQHDTAGKYIHVSLGPASRNQFGAFAVSKNINKISGGGFHFTKLRFETFRLALMRLVFICELSSAYV